jgi:hypothetical protein
MTGLRATVKSSLKSDAGGASGVGNETFVIDVQSMSVSSLSAVKKSRLRDLLTASVLAGLHLLSLGCSIHSRLEHLRRPYADEYGGPLHGSQRSFS